MFIYIAIAVGIALNLLLWGVTLYEVRRMHKQHKRELQIKMQRVAKLFSNVITRVEALERDKGKEKQTG